LKKASEGKRTVREELEIALAEQIETYAQKREVLGVEDVEKGVRVAYPTTIYNLSGDDTSGIAGLLYPSGEFAQATEPPTTQRYWEHEETLRYVQVEGELNEAGLPRVVGDSWREGEVVWSGDVAGSIEPNAEEVYENQPVHKRTFDASLGSDWMTTGELWKALERGTGMQNGPQPGKIHGVAITEDYGGWRQAA
jgi:hypothetical protein